MTPRHRFIAAAVLVLSSAPADLAGAVPGAVHLKAEGRGATILLGDGAVRAIDIVTDGRVKPDRIAPNGSGAMVAILTRGRGFGEAVALRRVVHPLAAKAVADGARARIEAAALTCRNGPIEALAGAQRLAGFRLERAPRTAWACTVLPASDKSRIVGRSGTRTGSLRRAFVRLRGHGVTVRRNRPAVADEDTSAAPGQAP